MRLAIGRLFIWGLCVLIGVVGLSPARAEGEKVVVLRGEGDAADIRDMIEAVLEGDLGYRAVGNKQVASAKKELGLEELDSDRALQKLGSELTALAVLRLAASDLAKGGHKVVVRVVYPSTKRKPRQFTIYYGAQAAEGSIRKKLRETLETVVAGAAVAGKGSSDESDEGNAEERNDEAASEPSTAASVAALRGGSRAAVRFDFGPSTTLRQLSFTSRPIDNPPRGYSNTPVPGARVGLELYPLAFASPVGAGAGLGFGVEYDRTLALSVRLRNGDGALVTLPTAQSNLAVDLRYRFVFGRKATSPALVLKAGYGQRAFVVDRTALPSDLVLDMPDVTYKMLQPGAMLRVPLGASLALVAAGQGLLIFDAGAIQKPQEYGQATIVGGAGSLALDIALGRRFGLRAAADVTVIGFSFKGNGEQTSNRDQEPASKDVGGARDLYAGGSLTLVIQY